MSVTLTRGEHDRLLAASREAEALRAALEKAERKLSWWKHGEDCCVWSERDDDPEDYDPFEADACDPHCDCGMSELVGGIRAALATPAAPVAASEPECSECGHETRWHMDGACACEGDGVAGLCPCPAAPAEDAG